MNNAFILINKKNTVELSLNVTDTLTNAALQLNNFVQNQNLTKS